MVERQQKDRTRQEMWRGCRSNAETSNARKRKQVEEGCSEVSLESRKREQPGVGEVVKKQQWQAQELGTGKWGHVCPLL